ncbi:hypothetical protein ALC60_07973 [Trachymyrmex zeteki]|uniref:Uncharacterized protein n=1 Tax=Mycetomoellerius zeteki TaxID=64791 RepID=A0A151WYX7_9HYME|nr:hypothetical protein ALC60_07973 [Trachymyrmex zeteki]
MQNYRAGPVGPVGARGVPRGTGEGTSGRREVKRGTRQEGPAAPQPTSTSGLVKMKPKLYGCSADSNPLEDLAVNPGVRSGIYRRPNSCLEYIRRNKKEDLFILTPAIVKKGLSRILTGDI